MKILSLVVIAALYSNFAWASMTQSEADALNQSSFQPKKPSLLMVGINTSFLDNKFYYGNQSGQDAGSTTVFGVEAGIEKVEVNSMGYKLSLQLSSFELDVEDSLNTLSIHGALNYTTMINVYGSAEFAYYHLLDGELDDSLSSVLGGKFALGYQATDSLSFEVSYVVVSFNYDFYDVQQVSENQSVTTTFSNYEMTGLQLGIKSRF
jgi:hypothetical protein